MPRAMLFFLSLLVSFALAPSAQAPEEPAALHLVVLHTNDVHGQAQPRKVTSPDAQEPRYLGGLPRLAAYAQKVRAEVAAEANAELLFVDAGDWFQGTPEGKLDEGLGFVRAMVATGYDVMCIGNHEFDYGLASIERVLAESAAPAMLANVFLAEGGARFPSVPPYRIVERGGMRIALVGFVTPTTPTITHPEARKLRFDDPPATLTAIRAELEDVDWILPVGHIGVEAGRRLAVAHPDLPLVVTGHAHKYLAKGEREGETLIVQAGSKGTVMGRVDTWWNRTPEGWSLERSEARLVELEQEPANEYRVKAVEATCVALVEKSAATMDVVVGRLTAPLEPARGLVSSSAGSWLCDVMRARFNVPVALHNKGGTRAAIAAGDVTRREVFEMLPFDNTVVLLELSGVELFECARRAVEGGVHSGLDVSGMVLHVEQRDTGLPGTAGVSSHLIGLDVGDFSIVPGATYRVATNSFLARGGDGYLEADWPEAVVDTGVVLADLAEQAFAGEAPVEPPSDNRFKLLQAELVK